jgi:hypothetical protein
VRELVVQTRSLPADHESDQRQSIENLLDTYVKSEQVSFRFVMGIPRRALDYATPSATLKGMVLEIPTGSGACQPSVVMRHHRAGA